MSLGTPVAFDGQDGNLDFGSNMGISVREWNITIDGEKLNTTSTGDGGFRTNIVGPIGAEGTLTANVDDDGAALYDLITPGGFFSTFTAHLGSSTHQIDFSANILSAEIKNPAEEVVTVDIKYCSTGPIVISS